jgi:hypothetical protein
MPVLKNDQGKPAYTSAELKYNKQTDEYYGETKYYDSKGNSQTMFYTIPLASSITLSNAQRTYYNWLVKTKNEF